MGKKSRTYGFVRLPFTRSRTGPRPPTNKTPHAIASKPVLARSLPSPNSLSLSRVPRARSKNLGRWGPRMKQTKHAPFAALARGATMEQPPACDRGLRRPEQRAGDSVNWYVSNTSFVPANGPCPGNRPLSVPSARRVTPASFQSSMRIPPSSVGCPPFPLWPARYRPRPSVFFPLRATLVPGSSLPCPESRNPSVFSCPLFSSLFS